MPGLTKFFQDKVIKLQEEEVRVGGETTTVKIVDSLLDCALNIKCSDIHMDFKEDSFTVRYRLNGMLEEVMVIPKSLGVKVASRIKVLAGMDITQTRMPQDGRKTIIFKKDKIDLRISTLPTNYGESIVLRILPKDFIGLGLNELGLDIKDYDKIKRIISKKWGMILVVGPTGSGKTTTLYAILKEINNSRINIVSLEDPVECTLPFIRQSQVKYDVGYTFPKGLRSILRQDPDVIMVGEIRDEETLNTAFKAALTGHLVFSTLHTRDSIEVLSRLREMGLPDYLIASALNGVVAQRLVRKEKDNGRIGLFEILEIDESMESLINRGCSSSVIRRKLYKDGYRSLMEDGISKVNKGITSREEILIALGEYD